MSDESKEQTKSLLTSVSSFVFTNISKARNIPVSELDKIANEALVQQPADAVTHKLITNTGYFDEFETALRANLKVEKNEKVDYITLSKYAKAEKLVEEGNRDNRIAIIVGEGEINSGEGDNESIGSETIVKELEKARKDDKVKAVVLRINSPGGSALASDVMWREIQLVKKEKPIHCFYGRLCGFGWLLYGNGLRYYCGSTKHNYRLNRYLWSNV